ncbi:MAG: acyl-CoA thioesterase [Acidimicrobiia bacterium]|nr:acyl-CoA thioesterase [Acidimicrobiia bacterium]
MVHTTTVPVRFSELDPYGHVNHAVYATYLEIGRVTALDAHGLGLTKVGADGFQFVVVELRLRFRAPAEADDVLTVETGVAEIKRVSTQWRQRIVRGEDILVTADVRSAVTDRTGRPLRPPPWMIEALGPLRTDA